MSNLPSWLQGTEEEKPAPASDKRSDSQLLQAAIFDLTEAGWQIVNQSPEGLQVRKAKRWNALGVLAFVVLPLLGFWIDFDFLYVAAAGLLFVLADYLLRKDSLAFVPMHAIQQNQHMAHVEQPVTYWIYGLMAWLLIMAAYYFAQ